MARPSGPPYLLFSGRFLLVPSGMSSLVSGGTSQANKFAAFRQDGKSLHSVETESADAETGNGFFNRPGTIIIMIETVEQFALMTLKLAVALGLGGLVGLERQLDRKPAGLRTHMLVSIGACLFTIVSIEGFGMDPARVAAGIVTGIGFLGAGAIMSSGHHVRGITTAATLWVTAAIGLAVGTGMYITAMVTSILVFAVLRMWKLEEGMG
jgi:putative Mg2+ transporter-C (MgtC) family protein